MPPKRPPRNPSSKQIKNVDEVSTTKLVKKKEIPQTDESDDESFPNYLYRNIDQKNVGSGHQQTMLKELAEFDHAFRETEEESKVENPEDIEDICMVCLQQDFQDGRYILICRHIFCNSCFSYWSKVMKKCPTCRQQSDMAEMILDGQSRTKSISPSYHPLTCLICQKSDDEYEMYFCDLCENKHVHIYCQPTLRKSNGLQERWLCEECRKSEPFITNKRKKARNPSRRPVRMESITSRLRTPEEGEIERRMPSRQPQPKPSRQPQPKPSRKQGNKRPRRR